MSNNKENIVPILYPSNNDKDLIVYYNRASNNLYTKDEDKDNFNKTMQILEDKLLVNMGYTLPVSDTVRDMATNIIKISTIEDALNQNGLPMSKEEVQLISMKDDLLKKLNNNTNNETHSKQSGVRNIILNMKNNMRNQG